MRIIFFSFLAMAGMNMVAHASATDDFITEMIEVFLNGGRAQLDIESRVMDLPISGRFEAIIFLRRSGLLVGPEWSLDQILDEIPSSTLPE